MNSLIQIIQAIATAVNSKMTMTLSHRIAQMSSLMEHTQRSGWIEKTSAGRAIQDRRILSSGNAVRSATSEHAQARASALAAAADWVKESLNPTGKDLAALAKTAEELRIKMDEAARSLDQVTKENDRIRANAISSGHARRASSLADQIDSQTGYRDELNSRHSTIRAAITEETVNPTGMDPANMQRMVESADAYKNRLDEANESLGRLNNEQNALRAAVDASLKIREGISDEEARQLEQLSNNVSGKTNTRNLLQNRYQAASTALQAEIENPTGKSNQQLLLMAATVERLRNQLDKANQSVQRASEEYDRLSTGVQQRARAELASNDRRPQSVLGRRLRKASYRIKKMLGPGGRRAVKSFERKARQYSDAIFHPKKTIANRDAAVAKRNAASDAHYKSQSAERQAIAEHQKAVDLNRRAPSQVAREQVSRSGDLANLASGNAKATGAALEAAEAEATSAEAMIGMAEAAAVLNEVLPGVGAVITVVAGVIEGALLFVNQTLAQAKQEVERFRHERSTYSGMVASAVQRYDFQSKQLEMRSSRATAGSANGVVNATMELREAKQDKSERWENIGNVVTALLTTLATGVTHVLNAFDFITPIVEGLLKAAIETVRIASLGQVDLSDLLATTKKNNINPGLETITALVHGIQGGAKDRAFPPLPPIVPREDRPNGQPGGWGPPPLKPIK